MTDSKLPKLMRINLWLLVAIIIWLPFQGFITTWPGSNFGHLLIWRAWKEVLLLIMGGLLIIQAFRDPKAVRAILSRRINQLILAFTSLLLILWLILRPNTLDAINGMIVDVRFLAIFVMAQVLAYYGWRPSWQFLAKIILIPAAIVVIFGLLQVTLLPDNFLSHFGYSKSTIAPFYTLYHNSDVIRISSFLRGPNPLGAYLILPFTLLLAWLIKGRKDFKWWYLLWLIPGLVTLYASQSRSAWLGLGLSIAILAWWGLDKKWRPRLTLAGLLGLAVVAILFVKFQSSDFIQNSVFHTGENHNTSQTSNSGHIDSIETSSADIINHPLGEGPGSAGPASVRDLSETKIVENYYLQIAEEAGWLGLALLISIIALALTELYKKRSDMWALTLLASLVGISVANLFLPVWADDTLSLIWWALAGLVIYLPSANSNENAKTAQKPSRASGRSGQS